MSNPEGESFFGELDQAQGAGDLSDPFGLDRTMPDLEATARMEERMLLTTAERLLDNLGTRAEITFDVSDSRILDEERLEGAPRTGPTTTATVLTTRNEAEYRVGDRPYYLRPFRFAPTSRYGSDIFYALDEIPGAEELAVRNPFLIKLESGDRNGEIPGLQVRSGDGSMVPNTPESVRLLLKLTKQIEKAEINDANEFDRAVARDKEFRARRQAEQARFDAERASEAALGPLRKFGREVREYVTSYTVGEIAGIIGFFAVVATAITAGGLAIKEEITKCDRACEIRAFDKGKPRLDKRAVVLRLGDEDIEIPYIEVGDSPVFDRDTTPELGDRDSAVDGEPPTFGPNAPGGGESKDDADITNLRAVVFTTSNVNTDTEAVSSGDPADDLTSNRKNNAYCETVFVDLDEGTDGVAVATTRKPDRDHRFIASLSSEAELELCWVGEDGRLPEEDGKGDDPVMYFNAVKGEKVASGGN